MFQALARPRIGIKKIFCIDIILYRGIVISLSTIDNIITCINLHESFEQGTDISNVVFRSPKQPKLFRNNQT